MEAAILALLSVLVSAVGYLAHRSHKLDDRLGKLHVEMASRVSRIEGRLGIHEPAAESDTADAA
ncbi:MAG: hypothetical protein OXH20_07920 [bacterium]|nr:hypothetical protein [bacterium]MDE0669938.1 hypothetical protein [bacterium]